MLKEKLIELLTKNPDIYHAYDFVLEGEDRRLQHDLVGLILKVSNCHLQTNDSGTPRLPRGAPGIEQKWLDYEFKSQRTLTDFISIPALARQLWAAEYGDREAMRLPFYDEPGEGEVLCRYWDDMESVTADLIIQVLRDYEDIYELNEYAPEDD